MKTLIVTLISCFCLFAAKAFGADLTERYERSISRLSKANTESERFYALREAAKLSFTQGRIDAARNYAKELSTLALKFEKDWNYGNAIHDANVVLGRIAVHEGDIERAKHCLLEAGKTPGSPQLNSFGPNVSLAKDLLEKGEREIVLKYIELCRGFWTNSRGRLEQWEADIKARKMPNFGANLVY